MRLSALNLLPDDANDERKANAASVLNALDRYGQRVGLDQPHRLAQYLPQIAHENAWFQYDEEIWGPTAAQKRYDVREDLGNTPERDGDGKLYRGRTGIQITGKHNYRQFRDWCRGLGLKCPDFVQEPDAVNTDPWEGLAPIWYWDTRNLNRYADTNDIEMITRRINGGLNGYDDRLANYTKIGLMLLGYGAGKAGIRQFQVKAAADGLYTADIDGIDGPKTRAAIHQALVALGTVKATKPAPVTEEVLVAPKGSDKVAPLNTGISLVGLGGVVTALGDFLGGLHPIAQGGALLLIAAGAVVVWRDRASIAKAARKILRAAR